MLQCDQSNQMKPYSEQCSPGGTVYYAIQGGSNFWVCGWKRLYYSRIIQIKATEQNIPGTSVLLCSARRFFFFWICRWNPKVWGHQTKAAKQRFPVVLFIYIPYRLVFLVLMKTIAKYLPLVLTHPANFWFNPWPLSNESSDFLLSPNATDSRVLTPKVR